VKRRNDTVTQVGSTTMQSCTGRLLLAQKSLSENEASWQFFAATNCAPGST
jgi:hypothetical protein